LSELSFSKELSSASQFHAADLGTNDLRGHKSSGKLLFDAGNLILA